MQLQLRIINPLLGPSTLYADLRQELMSSASSVLVDIKPPRGKRPHLNGRSSSIKLNNFKAVISNCLLAINKQKAASLLSS